MFIFRWILLRSWKRELRTHFKNYIRYQHQAELMKCMDEFEGIHEDIWREIVKDNGVKSATTS